MSSTPGHRKEFVAFEPVQARWSDNDAYGHLNNAAYYALFDTAISNWQIANGLALTGADASKFVVVENGCRYWQEAAYPDRLTIGLRIPRIGTSSFRIETALFRQDDDTAASEGFFAMVHLGPDGRPEPLPANTRSVLARLMPRNTSDTQE